MKIQNIQVHQAGPLKKTFQLEAKGFNLIFGPNEAGKTYLIEALSSWLLGKAKGVRSKQKSRDWKPVPSGSVELTGLDQNDLTKIEIFGSDSKSNLTTWFSEEKDLSLDFSKLLVVRAGETLIESPESLIKETLSGSGMLEGILADKNISKTLKSAVISNTSIEGNNAGDIKDHRELRDSLRSLRSLRDEFSGGTGLELNRLHEESLGLENKLKELAKAKRIHAYQLSLELVQIKEKSLSFPEDLDELKENLSSLNSKTEEVGKRQADLDGLDQELVHREWATNGHSRYKELKALARKPVLAERKLNPVLLILAATFLLGSCGTFVLLPYPWVTGVSGFAGLVSLLLWRLLPQRTESIIKPVDDPELTDIRLAFEKRFAEQLSGEPVFQAKIDQLNQKLGQRNQMHEELKDLNMSISILDTKTEARMHAISPGFTKEEWDKEVSKQIEEKKKLLGIVVEKQRELDRFGVNEQQFLNEEIGVGWDSELETSLSIQLEAKNEALQNAKSQEVELKHKIAGAIGKMSDDWESLISGLEEKIDEQANNYKKVTAEILAKVCVLKSALNLQKDEDQTISENLKSFEVIEDLTRVGGDRFSGFGWQDGKLVVLDEAGRSDTLDFLSTGAKEQVMIALRILFARRYLEKTPAFLLLDDAFQHSDYNRRKHLVAHTLRLVRERGWQVFYFTMDNHLRDMFKEQATNQLGEDFTYHMLS